MPVPVYRGVTAPTGVTSTSISVAVPAATQVGDCMLFCYTADDDSSSGRTWPTGFTQQESGGGIGSRFTRVLSKIAEAADLGASHTLSYPSARVIAAGMIVYSGTGRVDPVVDSDSWNGNASSVNRTTQTVATAEADILTIDVFGAGWSNAGTVATFTPASGTERADGGGAGILSIEIVESMTGAPGTASSTTLSIAKYCDALRLVLGPRYWENPTTPGAFTVPSATVYLTGKPIAADWGDSSGVESLTYSLYYKLNGGAEVEIATGIATSTYNWTPTAPGSYQLVVYPVTPGKTGSSRTSSTFTVRTPKGRMIVGG